MFSIVPSNNIAQVNPNPFSRGYNDRLKAALSLMSVYRLAIEEIKDSVVITSYTRWIDAVQVKGAEKRKISKFM
jgi:hypothetical protein